MPSDFKSIGPTESSSPSAASHDHDAVFCLKAHKEDKTFWGMRNDVRRIVLYEAGSKTFSISRTALLHPTEGIILALFDGTRTVRDVETSIQHLLDLGPEAACAAVDAILQRRREALFETPILSIPGHPHRPEHLILPAYNIDLTSHKMYKPITMLFHLSDDCMRNCVYCDVEKRKRRDTKDLGLARWLELMGECVDLEIPSVTLGGGDPFVNRHIVTIVAALLQGGIHPLVATKSHVSRSTAGRLADAGLKRMQVSIDAGTPGLADLMTGSPGFFHGATESIRNLRAAGIRVRSNCVMTHINARRAGELIELLLTLGVDDISLTGVGRSPYIHADLNESLFLDDADREFLEQIGTRYPKDTVSVSGGAATSSGSETVEERWRSFAGRSRCSAGAYGFIVHCDGKVTLCDEMPTDAFNVVGDVARQSLMQVWSSSRIGEVLQPQRDSFLDSPCYDCVDFIDCHEHIGRCFRDAWKAYDSYFMPMPTCPLAPQGIRLY